MVPKLSVAVPRRPMSTAQIFPSVLKRYYVIKYRKCFLFSNTILKSYTYSMYNNKTESESQDDACIQVITVSMYVR